MKNTIKHFKSLLIVVCLALTSANAQTSIGTENVGGPPMTGKTYINVKGSPYLLATWERGNVTMASGRKFENLDLMFDQVLNQLIFKDVDGSSKAFIQPIVSFTIGKEPEIHHFERGTNNVFYEKLSGGKVNLWKKNQKTLIDEKPYGSATVQRNVLNNTSYYVGELAIFNKIKNDKKTILEVLSDKAPEIEAYMKKEKLNPKTEIDLIKIFQYYNSL